jgi:hypothetical protein
MSLLSGYDGLIISLMLNHSFELQFNHESYQRSKYENCDWKIQQ